MKATSRTKTALAVAVMLGTGLGALQTSAADLFYTASGPGYYAWDVTNAWIMYDSGNTPYGQLPTTNDNVLINATSPKAENGNALTVTNGVFAECNLFASGYRDYPGTAWFRLDGGSLTCRTDFTTGLNYRGLATLESGTLYGGGVFSINTTTSTSSGIVTNNGAYVDFLSIRVGRSSSGQATLVQNGGSINSRNQLWIGDTRQGLAELNGGAMSCSDHLRVGSTAGGIGTLINHGAQITTKHFSAGYEAGAYGSVTHNGGSLTVSDYLQVGRNGGVGEFQANAPFSARIMIVGTGVWPTIPGTGAVTVASGFTNVVTDSLKVNNGELVMRGGAIQFNRNAGLYTLINGENPDGAGVIRGWGDMLKDPGDTAGSRNPYLDNNGLIIADGEGEERDLSFHEKFVAVTNTVYNGATGTSGWYAVNKGRVRYPRTYFASTTGGGTYSACYGDWRTDESPDLVNSVKLVLTTGATKNFYIYGELYAPDRSDIPAGLPEKHRTIGIWRLGAYLTDSPTGTPSNFSTVLPTFRYDHTQVKEYNTLALYRHNGSAWVQVGSGVPDGTSLLSSDNPLPAVSQNIGWFAVVVKPQGTLISVQ